MLHQGASNLFKVQCHEFFTKSAVIVAKKLLERCGRKPSKAVLMPALSYHLSLSQLNLVSVWSADVVLKRTSIYTLNGIIQIYLYTYLLIS